MIFWNTILCSNTILYSNTILCNNTILGSNTILCSNTIVCSSTICVDTISFRPRAGGRYILPKQWYPPMWLHGGTAQNTPVWICSVMKSKSFCGYGRDKQLEQLSDVISACSLKWSLLKTFFQPWGKFSYAVYVLWMWRVWVTQPQSFFSFIVGGSLTNLWGK
jgi:hypothetical protein